MEKKANDLIPQVLEYLNKKGYSRSEAMLRMESNTEGGSLQAKADEPIGIKYMRAFGEYTGFKILVVRLSDAGYRIDGELH